MRTIFQNVIYEFPKNIYAMSSIRGIFQWPLSFKWNLSKVRFFKKFLDKPFSTQNSQKLPH